MNPWDERYSSPKYLYGTEPNDFLAGAVEGIAPGRALCLADGEGRNGVFLAELGHEVTSVDFSTVGMGKAETLARHKGLDLTTVVADLATYDLGEGRWDLIVSIFAHTSPDIRRRVHSKIHEALAPGGIFILEAYTPDQVGRGTGGPPNPELTMTLDGVAEELHGLALSHGLETVRLVIEGPGHTGDGAVVQVIAKR